MGMLKDMVSDKGITDSQKQLRANIMQHRESNNRSSEQRK